MVSDIVFNRQVDRNLKGKELEKSGKVDEAIKLYEKNIAEIFIGTHPYNRLAIIYRRRKQFDEEIRVLKKSIQVFNHYQNTHEEKKLQWFKDRLEKARYLKKRNDEKNLVNNFNKCKFCGTKNPELSNFCMECGKIMK